MFEQESPPAGRASDTAGDGDRFWMAKALKRGRFAGEQGEVPIGAIVVSDGAILGAGWNATEAGQDPTAHAEMVALRQAAAALGSRRLTGCDLYVTLEPCAMCAGALLLARIRRVVFGAFDAKAGACGTLRNVVADPRLNHTCQVTGGVLHDECAGLLQSFFEGLRRS
jgi:tRNA(Arg) A34 adenosine deaminase TadA